MKSITEAVQRMGINSIAILTSDILARASTLLVYVLVGRYAGDEEFGQLSLGLMLLYTFHVFAVAGLPTLLVREVAPNTKSARRILFHGYLAALFPSIASLLAMVGFAIAMRYSWSTTCVILLLALALIPYSLNMIAESVIRGCQRMPWIVIGNLPGSVLLVVGCFLTIQNGASVVNLASVVVVSRFVNLLSMHACCLMVTKHSKQFTLRLRYAWLLLMRSLVFLWSDGIVAISASLNSVLLSKFAGEREVGWLTACFQLLQPMFMIYRSVGNSCFPVLVQNAHNKKDGIGEICQTLIVLLLRMAIPAAVVVFSVAGDVLVFVYGKEEFRAATPILQLLAFTLLLDIMNPVIGHGLWAAGKDKLVLNIVVVNFVVSSTLSCVLITQYGIIGAAWAVLLSSVVNLVQHYVYFQIGVGRLQLFGELLRMIPILVAAGACLFLPLHIYAQLALALTVYGILNLWALRPLVANFSLKNLMKSEPEQGVTR
jgi:O-antigen/teichoic acid export membrane protein